MNFLKVVCLTVGIAGIAAGCMGYRVGTSLPAGVASVYVPTFKNQTIEPMLEADTTRATVEDLQTDGSLKVKDASRADARLDVVLTALTLEPVVYERNDAKVPEEYRLVISADLTLVRTGTEEKVFSRKVKGEKLFKPGGDLDTAKRTAIPKASKDLAHKIVQAVTEYW